MSEPTRVLELRSVRGTGGGPEKTILLGAARTDRSRFQVTVCYLRDGRDEVFGIDEWAGKLNVDYVELIERNSFDPSLWQKLRRLVRERRPHVIHAHEYKTDAVAVPLAKLSGAAPLSTVHGWTGHSARERRLYYPLDKQILRLYPRLIAVSDEIRGELINHGVKPDRVVTVLNAIDPSQFKRNPAETQNARARFGLASDALVMGAVGRLEPQKRFDILIDAFARVKAQYRDAVLAIAGDGSLRRDLADHASKSGVAESCRFLGHQTDVVAVHNALDLFVQSSDYEGSPNSVLEAMAMETPIVATEAGATRDLLENGACGVLVPRGDPEMLADAIVRSLSDRPEAQRKMAAARLRVETDLSFESRMNKVERIYDELAAPLKARR